MSNIFGFWLGRGGLSLLSERGTEVAPTHPEFGALGDRTLQRQNRNCRARSPNGPKTKNHNEFYISLFYIARPSR